MKRHGLTWITLAIALAPTLGGCGVRKAIEYSWTCRQAREATATAGAGVVRQREIFEKRIRDARPLWASASQVFLETLLATPELQRPELIRRFGLSMTPNATDCLELQRLYAPAPEAP